MEGGIKEPGVPGDVPHQGVRITVVGHVAAAFSGDEELPSQTGVPLQKEDGSAPGSCLDGSHHAGCAATDNQGVGHGCSFPEAVSGVW